MDDVRPRLSRCFSLVFPDLQPQEIETATTENVGAWDSVAAITLINVIEEEFGTPVDLELLPELSSFRAFEAYLRGARDPAAGTADAASTGTGSSR